MEKYSVWEGHMDDLMKKVTRIKNKCKKFGCDFHFEKVGEEFREVEDPNTINPITGKPVKVVMKFFICEAEGTALVNGWEYIGSVEHTSKGNIFCKAMTDVEIPERYRCSDPYCEHCGTNRRRKNTFIVRKKETGEFKQVGDSCLMDFTHGMSASFATYMASLRSIFEEAEKPVFGGNGWSTERLDTREVLQYIAETIRHFGYTKSDTSGSTKSKALDFYNYTHGRTRMWTKEEVERVSREIDLVGFNPDSEEATKMVDEVLDWIGNQETTNDYMHNLKVVTSLSYMDYWKFGLLVSLFPTWNRDLELQARKKAEMEAGKMSKHVGEIGDKIIVKVESIKCLTSWESCFNGYTTTTTYIWKICGDDGNVYTWKTSKWLNEEYPPNVIKGTVKAHNEFRGVKQTELTRCRTEHNTKKSVC